MSRIGRTPIAIPAGVTVEVAENNKVTVKGPKGTLTRTLPAEMEIKVEGAVVKVSRRAIAIIRTHPVPGNTYRHKIGDRP